MYNQYTVLICCCILFLFKKAFDISPLELCPPLNAIKPYKLVQCSNSIVRVKIVKTLCS